MSRTCIINTETQRCENVIVLEPEERNTWKSYAANLAIAPDHSGEIGQIWDASTSQWQSVQTSFTDTEIERQARNKRRVLLKRFVDIYHPLRWNSLTPEQQSAVADYRQALLDITDQPGFPGDVQWPARPSF